jgi:hypothetical protein
MKNDESLRRTMDGESGPALVAWIDDMLTELERAALAGVLQPGTHTLLVALLVGLRLQVVADTLLDVATAREVVALAARWQAVVAALDPDALDDEIAR